MTNAAPVLASLSGAVAGLIAFLCGTGAGLALILCFATTGFTLFVLAVVQLWGRKPDVSQMVPEIERDLLALEEMKQEEPASAQVDQPRP